MVIGRESRLDVSTTRDPGTGEEICKDSAIFDTEACTGTVVRACRVCSISYQTDSTFDERGGWVAA